MPRVVKYCICDTYSHNLNVSTNTTIKLDDYPTDEYLDKHVKFAHHTLKDQGKTYMYSEVVKRHFYVPE